MEATCTDSHSSIVIIYYINIIALTIIIITCASKSLGYHVISAAKKALPFDTEQLSTLLKKKKK